MSALEPHFEQVMDRWKAAPESHLEHGMYRWKARTVQLLGSPTTSDMVGQFEFEFWVDSDH